MMAAAKRPIFYTGGGIINSGPGSVQGAARAGGPDRLSRHLDPDGAGRLSRPRGREWLGMLGMHGTWEANHAMHDCDLMICLGARFDDRVTGRIDAFSPGSKKIHLDIDASQINKIVRVDLAIVADAAKAHRARWCMSGRPRRNKADKPALKDWWAQIDTWRAQEIAGLQEFRHPDQAAICRRPAL